MSKSPFNLKYYDRISQLGIDECDLICECGEILYPAWLDSDRRYEVYCLKCKRHYLLKPAAYSIELKV